MSNPFVPLIKEEKPTVVKTDYHKDGDTYIISYDEVQKVKMTGEKDTDFIIEKEVVETGRINRQDYIDEQGQEVGIMNILEKVRRSKDETLFDQTGRVGYPSDEVDALGRPVEKIVDVTDYQIDKVEGLERYKKGVQAYNELDPDLKKKKKLSGVAKIKDEDLDSYINDIVTQRLAALTSKKENIDESSK